MMEEFRPMLPQIDIKFIIVTYKSTCFYQEPSRYHKGGLSAKHSQELHPKLELVSKELNHLAAILHVYVGGLILMK